MNIVSAVYAEINFTTYKFILKNIITNYIYILYKLLIQFFFKLKVMLANKGFVTSSGKYPHI